MKNIIKAMVVLEVVLISLGIIASCEAKSEQEQIKELVEKLGEAKTEQEVMEIAKKIQELQETSKKKGSTEVSVKLGEAFSFWQHGRGSSDPPKESQFRMTFKDPVVDQFMPWDPKFWELIKGHRTLAPRTPAEQGKKYFCIVAKIENSGPRESSPKWEMEVKVDKGFIYRLVATGIVDDPEKDYPREIYPLEPGKTGWLRLWCQIPEDTYPVEVFGKLGEGYYTSPGHTNFRLNLTGDKEQAIRAKGNIREERTRQSIQERRRTFADQSAFPEPYISLSLRMTTPDLVEKVEAIYLTALDYQFLSLRCLRYAEDFLDKGNVSKSNEYIEKADRYYRLALGLRRDSQAVLDVTYSAAEWMVVYKSSRTALGFTVTAADLGIVGCTLFDAGTLYTDYLLDISTTSLETAKRNLIARAFSKTLLRFVGGSEFVGDTVKRAWGSSHVFPTLQKIIGSSEFGDAVLKEFMRLGGDVGDYVAKKAIEEVLEGIIKGTAVRMSGDGGRVDDIPEDEMTWVKCNNAKCKAEYQIGLKEFYKAVQERMTPMAMSTPPLICKKCGEPSVFRAEKCKNPDCAEVFIRGVVPNDFQDRCPECGRSETEEVRKRRMAGGYSQRAQETEVRTVYDQWKEADEKREESRSQMRDRFGGRPRESGGMFQNLSEEDRAKLREEMEKLSAKWEVMSEEEREAARTQLRERFGFEVKVLAEPQFEEALEPTAPAQQKLVPIEVELPRPMFVGTPQDSRAPNLEKPLGRPRPPFLAPVGTKNVALGKLTASSDQEPIVGNLKMITDGDKEAVSCVELGPFLQHVTIDLGAPHEVYAIAVWHYHKEARVYFDVVVQVADDADFITNVRTVFNNDIDNSVGFGVGKDMHYTETNEGKLIDAKGVKARYVRLYTNGNTSNDLNHYVEVGVYGTVSSSVHPPSEGAPERQGKGIEPPGLQFKELSAEEEFEAQKLWVWVDNQRKMGRLPAMGYEQMAKTCREIIHRWPESKYAFYAKQALADLPQRYRKKISEADIVGKYTMLQKWDKGERRYPGVFFLKEDGSVVNIISGNWEVEGSRIELRIKCAEGVEETTIREIASDTMEDCFGFNSFLSKQDGAKIIKTLEIPVSTTSAGFTEVSIWSDYSGSSNDADEKLVNLRFKKDGTFLRDATLTITWGIEDGCIWIYDEGEPEFYGRIEGNTLVFGDDYRGKFREHFRLIEKEGKTEAASNLQMQSNPSK